MLTGCRLLCGYAFKYVLDSQRRVPARLHFPIITHSVWPCISKTISILQSMSCSLMTLSYTLCSDLFCLPQYGICRRRNRTGRLLLMCCMLLISVKYVIRFICFNLRHPLVDVFQLLPLSMSQYFNTNATKYFSEDVKDNDYEKVFVVDLDRDLI